MRLLTTIAAASLMGLAAAADEHGPATIRQMGYLTGAWEQTENGMTVREVWSEPTGSAMAGVSIAASEMPGKKTHMEFMSIVEKDGTLVFTARIDGQTPTDFTLKEADNGYAVFENPAHDFPQRIIYEIAGGMDVLKARIEGTIDGKPRSVDWTYRRPAP